MPRKDVFHDTVKNALVKEGWVITHDPYRIEYNREQELIKKEGLRLVLYNSASEVIEKWIE